MCSSGLHFQFFSSKSVLDLEGIELPKRALHVVSEKKWCAPLLLDTAYCTWCAVPPERAYRTAFHSTFDMFNPRFLGGHISGILCNFFLQF